jgi:hypothetical protein
MPRPLTPSVIPTKAGTQSRSLAKAGGWPAHRLVTLDPRVRGGDE